MIVIALLFAVLLVTGVPIAMVLGLTGFVHISLFNPGALDIMPQRMLSVINNFTLLAIPLFVLAGELMNSSGVTARLIDFARNFVGHLRGGLGYVNVMVGLFLGAILGSATAEAAIRGSTIAPEMEKKDGYERETAAAITATSSSLGPIFPPSIVFILYAVLANVSIGAMFLAGIFPALLITAVHFIYIYYYARKKGLGKLPLPKFRDFLISFVRALPALLVPVVILGGIFSGYFTATESGAIACLLALIIGIASRNLRLADVPGILIRSGITTAAICIIVATSNILGWSLAFEQVPQKATELFTAISENPLVILLLINLLLLVIGMFLDITAGMLIMVPVLVPVVTALGVDPIHFGLIVSLNLVIGLCTPPVGTVLFITSGIVKVPLHSLVRACIPLIMWMLVVLMIVTYVPEVSLYLPKAFGLIK